MTWWQVLLSWFGFVGSLAELQPGGEADSPPFYVTYQDGRRFVVNFHAKRVA